MSPSVGPAPRNGFGMISLLVALVILAILAVGGLKLWPDAGRPAPTRESRELLLQDARDASRLADDQIKAGQDAVDAVNRTLPPPGTDSHGGAQAPASR